MALLRHFNGVRFERGVIHFAKTGADISPNAAFFKSALAIAKINLAVMKRRNTRGAKSGTLAFYPDMPGPWYTAYFAAHIAGLELTNDVRAADAIFIFDDKTRSRAAEALSPDLAARAINRQITDISKTTVAAHFKAVFGYDIAIDPLTYRGAAVQKSDDNGTHDGTIVMCPLTPKALASGCVYQKLIESTTSGQSEDLRFAYADGEIVTVFHKYKTLEKRFGTDYARVDVKAAHDVFSEGEIKDLCRFCEAMGLDFGAVDTMRDKHDGKLYVVDVNKTCMPVLCLPIRVQMQVLGAIANRLSRLTARHAGPT